MSMPIPQFEYAKNFFYELFRRRSLIFDLGVRELQKRYFGSVLGVSCIILEQVIFVSVLWVVFTQGLKFRVSKEIPFLPWFITSYMLWIFISAAINSSTNIFRNYAYLLKKRNFNISILPVINLVQYIVIHSVFMIILIVVSFIYHIEFSWYWIQFLYYLFATLVFLLGASWLLASVSLFVQDVKNAVAVVIQLGFWLSPVYWEISNFPEQYHFILKLNPVHYLLQGYRDSFLYQEAFWNKAGEGAYFWCVTIVLLFAGMFTYKRLRPHFGDVI